MNILSYDYYADDSAELFTSTLKETSTVVLRTLPIVWSLIQTVYNVLQEFLKAGASDKYIYDVDNQDGYLSIDVSEFAKGETVRVIKHFYHLCSQNGRYTTEVSRAARELFEIMIRLCETILQ
ncbi:isopenicillin N synthase family oxygenase, partial [Francisella tularensis]|nr:isopenicillin N synthase family oxygenase [Francisella tularensis]